MTGFPARGFLSAMSALGLFAAAAVVSACDGPGPLESDPGDSAVAEAPGAPGQGAGHAAPEVQVVDVMDQEAVDGGLYAADAAELRRTPNGFTVQVQVPTPEPGSYAYPEGAEEGHPEAFTLWIFANGTPFWGAGHVVGGSHLTLSGHVSKETAPFDDSEPLGEAITDAEVHITIAPHGEVDPDKLPDQIQTPSGGPDYWWHADFD